MLLHHLLEYLLNNWCRRVLISGKRYAKFESNSNFVFATINLSFEIEDKEVGWSLLWPTFKHYELAWTSTFSSLSRSSFYNWIEFTELKNGHWGLRSYCHISHLVCCCVFWAINSWGVPWWLVNSTSSTSLLNQCSPLPCRAIIWLVLKFLTNPSHKSPITLKRSGVMGPIRVNSFVLRSCQNRNKIRVCSRCDKMWLGKVLGYDKYWCNWKIVASQSNRKQATFAV